ncbi:MAG: OsmC family protein [Armatimonadetes bacterium]|nr:OsmC family protein [Armatimonadota bacterium]
MPITTHAYPVTVSWQGGRQGDGNLRPHHSGVTIPIAVPPEFEGKGGATNPEELLTSAIGACYTITFGIIASNRKIPVQEINTEVTGEVEQNGASFTYTKVTLSPRIVLESSATDEQLKIAEDMAHKADLYCIVTNAVRGKVEVVVEPTITKA